MQEQHTTPPRILMKLPVILILGRLPLLMNFSSHSAEELWIFPPCVSLPTCARHLMTRVCPWSPVHPTRLINERAPQPSQHRMPHDLSCYTNVAHHRAHGHNKPNVPTAVKKEKKIANAVGLRAAQQKLKPKTIEKQRLSNADQTHKKAHTHIHNIVPKNA